MHDSWSDLAYEALKTIRDTHEDTGQPGASCREGCGGRWPCSTWAEANYAIRGWGFIATRRST